MLIEKIWLKLIELENWNIIFFFSFSIPSYFDHFLILGNQFWPFS